MDRREILTATATIGATVVAGCLSSGNNSGDGNGDEDENPYKSVVRENVQAHEEEDLELLKETLHEESPVYDETIEETQKTWSRYELTYELEEVEVTKQPEDEKTAAVQTMQVQQAGDCGDQLAVQSLQVQQEEGDGEDCGEEARVRFVQVTEKESGPEFRDNRVEGVHILRSSNDDWKIWDSVTEDVEYL